MFKIMLSNATNYEMVVDVLKEFGAKSVKVLDTDIVDVAGNIVYTAKEFDVYMPKLPFLLLMKIWRLKEVRGVWM